MYANAPISVMFLTHNDEDAHHSAVRGFLHLWAIYVRGFNAQQHCQRCLRGPISKLITSGRTPIRQEIVLDETRDFSVVYICGVSSGRVSDRSSSNLHLPLRPVPGEYFECETYNKYRIRVKNAQLLPIPSLEDWWMGYAPAFSRCSNFRFCVSFFGLPDREKRMSEVQG
jgi:hypothetical protein